MKNAANRDTKKEGMGIKEDFTDTEGMNTEEGNVTAAPVDVAAVDIAVAVERTMDIMIPGDASPRERRRKRSWRNTKAN